MIFLEAQNRPGRKFYFESYCLYRINRGPHHDQARHSILRRRFLFCLGQGFRFCFEHFPGWFFCFQGKKYARAGNNLLRFLYCPSFRRSLCMWQRLNLSYDNFLNSGWLNIARFADIFEGFLLFARGSEAFHPWNYFRHNQDRCLQKVEAA